tara:strand:- start:12674 stop:12862 length:189 start_codon:yes stop_codon:yes gene_type:complete
MMIPDIFVPTLSGALILAFLGFAIGAFVGWILWRRNLAESRDLIESLRMLKEEVTLLRKGDS